MIPVIQQQLFFSLSKQAKLLAAPHQSNHPHLDSLHKQSKHKKKGHHPIDHYSARNQRRIKQLRSKKVLDSDVIKLLRQEVKEHHLTRQHLLSALHSVQEEFHAQKNIADDEVSRKIALTDVHESIVSALLVSRTLDENNPEVQRAHVRLVKMEKLVRDKLQNK
jgi:hypothetical protein